MCIRDSLTAGWGGNGCLCFLVITGTEISKKNQRLNCYNIKRLLFTTLFFMAASLHASQLKVNFVTPLDFIKYASLYISKANILKFVGTS